MKQKDISNKIDKTREKLQNLRFANEHSDDPKNFMKMIEEEENKLRELNEREEDIIRERQRGKHSSD